MKRQLVLVVWSAVTLSSTLVLSSCSKPTGTESTAVQDRGQHANTEAAQKKEIWTCPMHPQVKKDGPGSCPICGMDLVKASAAGLNTVATETMPSGHAPVELNQGRQQMIGVKTGKVRREPLFKSIEASGRVAFDPELFTAQSEYLEAVKQLARVQDSPLADVRHSAERMVESAKLRLKILGLSDKQIQAMGQSGNFGSNLLIPRPGENLWIYAEVYEMDLQNVHPGLEAEISGSSLGGKTLKGKVVSVDRVINAATRTAKVRISTPEGKGLLRPESYVDVNIRSPLGEQVAVPFDALFDTGKEAWVFLTQDQGLIVPRKVSVKFRAGDWVAIDSGLEGGESIVTSANFLIDSESRLKGALLAQADDEGGPEKAATKKTPECPKGQFWHAEMGHCMQKVGE